MEPEETAVDSVTRAMFATAVVIGLGLQVWAALLMVAGQPGTAWFLLPVAAGLVAAAYITVTLVSVIRNRVISVRQQLWSARAATFLAIEFVALIAATQTG